VYNDIKASQIEHGLVQPGEMLVGVGEQGVVHVVGGALDHMLLEVFIPTSLNKACTQVVGHCAHPCFLVPHWAQHGLAEANALLID
jgi:hypothetical protein